MLPVKSLSAIWTNPMSEIHIRAVLKISFHRNPVVSLAIIIIDADFFATRANGEKRLKGTNPSRHPMVDREEHYGHEKANKHQQANY